MRPLLIYLHGFLSSPLSSKAQATARWLSDAGVDFEYLCPSVSSYPQEARDALLQLCEQRQNQKKYLVGSSLGGFWASYLIEQRLAEKAVLINPAVSPHKRFVNLLGQELKSYYSDERYCLREKDLSCLAACESAVLDDPDRYWVLLQSGDEVLDYRDAQQRYSQCKLTVEDGGSHSFEGYRNYLSKIIQYFNE